MESLDNPKISNGITVASFLLEAIDFFILHWSPILSIIYWELQFLFKLQKEKN